MVIRRKLRTLLGTLGLYVGCAMVISYFGINAYTGNHGLRAQQDLDQQFAALTDELARLKNERDGWERQVKLLRSNSINPDMLDEGARAVLSLRGPRDLTLMLKRPRRVAQRRAAGNRAAA